LPESIRLVISSSNLSSIAKALTSPAQKISTALRVDAQTCTAPGKGLNFFSSRLPYRRVCPTTSESDVRLSCSDQDLQRSRPSLACPRAAALMWGSRAQIPQRVPEYHNAPPGLTAKLSQKSSIFSRVACCPPSPPSLRARFVRTCCVYRCVSRRFGSVSAADMFYLRLAGSDSCA
jgi:hypothetical protein